MKIINNILILLMWIINVVSIVLKFTTNYEVNVLASLALSVVIIIPRILKNKLKISKMLEFIFLIFILIAGEIGSILKIYDAVYWYDSFAHLISGILTAFLAIIVLVRTKKYDNKQFFNILFIITFTLAIAASWEIFEFISDSLLGGDAQRVLKTGVSDTMKDIICALLGSILFIVGYLFKRPKVDNL